MRWNNRRQDGDDPPQGRDPFSGVPLNALRQFVVVSNTHNFRHPANVFGVTQPSVSAGIKALKEIVSGLKAIRDQAQADAERTQAQLESSGQQAITPEMVRRFVETARRRMHSAATAATICGLWPNVSK